MAADPFDELGVPARFDLSREEVRRAWLARTAAISARPGAGTEGATVVHLARLNEAKAALDHAAHRAEALLSRLGGPAPADDKSLPEGFLPMMLEQREEIEASLASGGTGARAEWEAWAIERRREHEQRVSEFFARLGPSPTGADPAALRAIRMELNAWRYIERLIEQLDPEYDAGRADFN